MGHLSTHILDTASGRPAAGIQIELSRLAADGSWSRIKSTTSNADGRTDEPLLTGATYQPGTYMLTFAVAGYFAGRASSAGTTPFLDIVPLRFTIAEADGHYHVPLLVSPWSYSTYRGS